MPVQLLKKLFAKSSSGNECKAALIVDEAKQIRELLEMHLSKMGYSVTKAANNDEALAKVEGGMYPSLVVAEIEKQTSGGVALAKKLRNNRATAKTPILFCTGSYAPSEMSKIGEMIDNSTAIRKPFSAKSIKDAISGLTPAPARTELKTKLKGMSLSRKA